MASLGFRTQEALRKWIEWAKNIAKWTVNIADKWSDAIVTAFEWGKKVYEWTKKSLKFLYRWVTWKRWVPEKTPENPVTKEDLIIALKEQLKKTG